MLFRSHDGVLAARSVRSNRIKVDERVVLLGIWIRITQVAMPGHGLLVGLPGASAGLDQVGKTGGIHEAIIAVAVDSEGVTTDQRNVVGQTWMRHCIVLRQQRVFTRQLVVGWHQGIADDLAEILVLEYDHDDVVEVWD